MSSPRAQRRGQSEVLGTVLLVGIVVLAALAVAGLALGAFGGTQEQADREAIEQSLLEFRSSVSAVALEGESHRVVHLEPPEGAQVTLNETAGSITFAHVDYKPDQDLDPEELYPPKDLGRLEMRYGDVLYGFEAGGIFKLEDGHGSMVAPPKMAYRDLTAIIPVLRLEGEGTKSGPMRISISPGEHILPVYPNTSQNYSADEDIAYENPVMNGSIEITVQSKFYEGWAQFFRQYTDGTVEVDHENESVTTILRSLQELEFTNAVTVQREISVVGNVDDGDWREWTYLPDSQPLIDEELVQASADNDNDEVDCLNSTGFFNENPCEIPAGTYYFEEDVVLDRDLEINTTDGNVSLIFDGDFNVKNHDITVTDPGEDGAKYYVNNTLEFQGNAAVTTDNPEIESYRNIFIVGGDVLIASEGSGTIDLDAVIYAPNADIETGGTPTFRGAVYANSLDLHGDAEVEYDPSLEGRPIDLSATPTPVMFLHLTENVANLEVD